ncbi:FAD/NAD(P)-binding domain-containing protein [Punctularia strigosozonata HHB-11173 SS5]|uniref:FAD/NAD(P)-binding domain-containing protein n=1 Tax=Punctularia strigosozonata (strain HHB-11173) TaxID=741275 RepID=UPI0004418533|nr:FAD/NAD(P)-binding domain-containing protein [Punctularia strigosozonata HHB-11173 SS5]EIN13097.1 FAD/NAD(P)-binding domain-containing protein [Punctularia strigosozonata HHB-11173 SS5]
MEANDAGGVLNLFVDEKIVDIYWRDLLALTWDFRTFKNSERIEPFLSDRLNKSKISNVKLDAASVSLDRPAPDLAWIRGFFGFETAVGVGVGLFRLVPVPVSGDGATGNEVNGLAWKAHTVFTNLKELKGFPEKVGPLREHNPSHGKWVDKRRREVEFEDTEPQVIVIGAGQSGLDAAARLKLMDIPTLVLEKQARIGDQWRNRYEALCLHDPVWYDHMPYLPFPPNWPVYTPAQKLADWLEAYAHNMELNVWTSATVLKTEQDEKTKKWTVVVRRGDGKERTFSVDHLVYALGLAGGVPNMPDIPGKEEFSGQILHSTQHHRATDHVGKKVVIVGACTSSHDIAADYVEHGVDVTIYQRSSTYIMSTKQGMPRMLGVYWNQPVPVEVADMLGASFPNYFLKHMHKRVARAIADADKKLLEDLNKVGFKTNLGPEDSGFLLMAYSRGGGYYLDVGASQMVIDGKIKIKNGSGIERFTKSGIKFADGSEIPADVVIFATGFGDPRTAIASVSGKEIADKCKPIWGLNAEGEIRGNAREIGLPNLWYLMGNLALCRFHSTHLALQIKAKQEGVFGTRYSAQD